MALSYILDWFVATSTPVTLSAMSMLWLISAWKPRSAMLRDGGPSGMRVIALS
jgi:hypothetical protein